MLNRGNYAARLNNALEVLETLSNHADMAALFGIDGPESPILQQGWNLYDIAFETHYARQRLWGVAVTAMAQCTTAFKTARDAQARLTLLARALFTSPGDRDRLGINGRRAEGLGAWLLQAEVFHTNLSDADRTRLNQFGVATAELERTAQLLQQLARDHAACIAAKAAAKTATLAKVTAFADLAAFLSPLIAVARGLESRYPKLPALLRMRPDQRRRPKRRTTQPFIEPQPNPDPEHDPSPDPNPDPEHDPAPDPNPDPEHAHAHEHEHEFDPDPEHEFEPNTDADLDLDLDYDLDLEPDEDLDPQPKAPPTPTTVHTTMDTLIDTRRQQVTIPTIQPADHPSRRPVMVRRGPDRSGARRDRADVRSGSRPGPNLP